MNKFMKKLMKKDGFTLVELIVVIAILAILAGVAVPVYSGYINNANKASDQQELEAIETAMSAALAMEGKSNADADTYFDATFNTTTGELVVVNGEATATETGTRIWSNFTQFYGANAVSKTLKYYDALSGDSASVLPKLLGEVAAEAPAANPA